MKNKKQHINKEERFVIEKMLKVGELQKDIARVLNKGQSTISEEIKRGMVNGEYTAEKAHHKAYVRQHNKKKDCLKVSMDKDLYKHIETQIKNRISPEDIAKELKKKEINYASGKAIRKFIHQRRPDLEGNLFWERNNMKSGKKRSKGVYLKDPNRKFIEKRDEEYGNLFDLQYGHWEGDFIVSKNNSFVLLVLVERFSKKVLIAILPNRKNTLVNERISSLLKNYTVKSLTLDNDIAFQDWKTFEKQLNCNIYFAHPYHSWEKGLVENMNRWIREFVPKKSDISNLSIDKLKEIQDWLNNKPRSILNGYTAYEIMTREEKGVMILSKLKEFPVRIWG